MIKCLHICNDFLGSKVHYQLHSALDKNDIEQHIFHPLRVHNRNKTITGDFSNIASRVYYSRPLKSLHKYLFRSKISYLTRQLKSKISIADIDIAHATTLYSDGAIALKLFKAHHIPYIVTIRATDIGIFLKFRPDLHFLALNILKNASKIVFISEALKDRFYNHYWINLFKARFQPKSVVIPNGVDQFWINNAVPKKEEIPHKILYVGTLIRRKNVLATAKAILKLQAKIPNIQFTIVGKKGEQEPTLKALAIAHPELINFIGPIYDKETLIKVFRANHIFAMPSFNETFGLVYIEALSQGLPIIFSKNEGVDGTFSTPIGESVDSNSQESIEKGIENAIVHYNKYRLNTVNFEDFSWKKIGAIYSKLYIEFTRSSNRNKIHQTIV